MDGGGQNSINVHIASFAGFGLTCVKASGSASSCPAWQKFLELNEGPGGPPDINSYKTIEGYFITGFVPGLGAGEPGIPDAGVYVLLLTK